MTTLHVIVEQAEDGWLAARSLENSSVHTQGRSLDEVTANIREVADLLLGEQSVQIELVIPSNLPLAAVE